MGGWSAFRCRGERWLTTLSEPSLHGKCRRKVATQIPLRCPDAVAHAYATLCEQALSEPSPDMHSQASLRPIAISCRESRFLLPRSVPPMPADEHRHTQ